MGSDTLSIPYEEVCKRHRRESNKGKKTVTPPKTEGVIHGLARERQDSTDDRPENGVCRNGTRGVDRESVDEV